MMTASALCAMKPITPDRSSAVAALVIAMPGRRASRRTSPSMLHAASSTRAPRSAAATASATPCLPLERLPRKRTGSIGSRVPPADTATVTPSRSRLGVRTPTAKA